MRFLFLILLLNCSFGGLAQSVENKNAPVSNQQIATDSIKQPDAVPITTKSKSKAKYEISQPHPATIGSERASPKKIQENRLDEIQVTSEEETVKKPSQVKMQFEGTYQESTHQRSRRSATPSEQFTLDQSAGYYRNNDPQSFETHFYTWLSNHYNVDLYAELLAAELVKPGDPAVQKQLAAYFIIKQEPAGAVEQIQKLIDQQLISKGHLSYAYDLLLSGEEDGIIITHGLDDLLAAYYVQQQENIRADVELISLELLQSKEYRLGLSNTQFQLPESTVIDTAYVTEMCALNADKVLQLSLTIPKEYFVGMKSDLYLLGLTFQYSKTPVDHFTRNENLWFSDFKRDVVFETFNDNSDQLAANYLPLMITLKGQLEPQSARWLLLEDTIRKAGEKTHTTKQVNKLVR